MKTIKTLTFNTGALYIARGQVITATLHSDGVVTFMDHSRMVDGFYTGSMESSFGAREVIAAYNAGRCKNDMRSFNDGMSRTGVNSATLNAEAIEAASLKVKA